MGTIISTSISSRYMPDQTTAGYLSQNASPSQVLRSELDKHYLGLNIPCLRAAFCKLCLAGIQINVDELIRIWPSTTLSSMHSEQTNIRLSEASRDDVDSIVNRRNMIKRQSVLSLLDGERNYMTTGSIPFGRGDRRVRPMTGFTTSAQRR